MPSSLVAGRILREEKGLKFGMKLFGMSYFVGLDTLSTLTKSVLEG